MILSDGCEMLLDILESIVKKKAYQCKVLIRSVLVLNKKDEKHFERSKTLVKGMIEGGWCSLPGDQWTNFKKGLVVYFVQYGHSHREEMKSLFQMLKESQREEMC